MHAFDSSSLSCAWLGTIFLSLELSLSLVVIIFFFNNLDKLGKKDSPASGKSNAKKKEKDNTVKEGKEKKAGVSNNTIAKNDASRTVEAKSAEKKPGETTPGQTTGSAKSVKKKIIKKIVKKVVNKTNDSAKRETDKPGEKDVADKVATSEVPVDEVKSSADPTGVQTSGKDIVAEDIPIGKADGEGKNGKEINSIEDNTGTNDATVKTIKTRKVIKRVPKKKVVGEASKSVVNEGNVVASQAQAGADSTDKQTAEADTIETEGKKPAKVVTKRKLKTPTSGVQDDATVVNEGNTVAVQAQDGTDSPGKQTADGDTTATEGKKPAKLVTKRNLKTPTSGVQDDATGSNKKVAKSTDKTDDENAVAAPANDDTQSTDKQAANADTKIVSVAKKIVKVVPRKKLKVSTSEKQEGAGGAGDSNKNEMKSDNDDKKDGKGTGEKSGSKIDKKKTSEKDTQIVKGKLKVGEKSKDEKVTKEKDGKDEPKSKSSREVKEKKKSDEPPRHPGFILQTKSTKDSKVRTFSLTLETYTYTILCTLKV